MQDAVGTSLSAWESFYVIVGSSAGALTGLQFVVMALVADQRRVSASSDTIGAFGTPNVVHFCAALLLSAILSAPWRSLDGPAIGLGAMGLAGMVYVALVLRRARRQKGYKPVFEDWLFHTFLPFAAYAGLVGGALAMVRDTVDALFWVGAVSLLLMFIGIHNAWDTATFIIIGGAQESTRDERPDERPSA
jgi:hypothetical protein